MNGNVLGTVARNVPFSRPCPLSTPIFILRLRILKSQRWGWIREPQWTWLTKWDIFWLTFLSGDIHNCFAHNSTNSSQMCRKSRDQLVQKMGFGKIVKNLCKKSPFLCNLPNSGQSSSRFHKIFGVIVILSVKTYNCYNR